MYCGLVPCEVYTQSVDSDIFFDFIRGNLIPQMNIFDGTSPKSIVIMDNCSIHHVPEVEQIFTDGGIVVSSFLHIVQTIIQLKKPLTISSHTYESMMKYYKQLMILVQLYVTHFIASQQNIVNNGFYIVVILKMDHSKTLAYPK